jgi:hypothetical protein
MLQMRARAFAARDGASDVLKGLGIHEEIEDRKEEIEANEAAQAQPAGPGVGARLQEGDGKEGFNASRAEADAKERAKTTKRQDQARITRLKAEAAEAAASDVESGVHASGPPDNMDAADAEVWLPAYQETHTALSEKKAEGEAAERREVETETNAEAGAAESAAARPEPEAIEEATAATEPAKDEDPFDKFIAHLNQLAGWIEVKNAMADYRGTDTWKAAVPAEQRKVALAIWALAQKYKIDPGADPTAFMNFLFAADDADMVTGTLGVLERSERFMALNDAQKDVVRRAAAGAVERIKGG